MNGRAVSGQLLTYKQIIISTTHVHSLTFNTLVIEIMNKHALFRRIQGHIKKHNKFPFNLQ